MKTYTEEEALKLVQNGVLMPQRDFECRLTREITAYKSRMRLVLHIPATYKLPMATDSSGLLYVQMPIKFDWQRQVQECIALSQTNL